MKKSKEKQVKSEEVQTENQQAEQEVKVEKNSDNEAINIEKLKEEFESEWKDKYIRLAAEFDNYRRRTLQEKMELTRSAGQDILTGILPVVDDFERGLNTIEKKTENEAVVAGLELIYAKFKEFLKQQGVSELEALHTEFNSDFHEALTKIPAPSEELKGKIVDVVLKGYKLNDKVIRFAKVVIGE